jgi:hypothetical protein
MAICDRHVDDVFLMANQIKSNHGKGESHLTMAGDMRLRGGIKTSWKLKHAASRVLNLVKPVIMSRLQ